MAYVPIRVNQTEQCEVTAMLPTDICIVFCNGLISFSDRSSRYICITYDHAKEYSIVKKLKFIFFVHLLVRALPEFKVSSPTLLKLPVINKTPSVYTRGFY
jgi:hypothetical protein